MAHRRSWRRGAERLGRGDLHIPPGPAAGDPGGEEPSRRSPACASTATGSACANGVRRHRFTTQIPSRPWRSSWTRSTLTDRSGGRRASVRTARPFPAQGRAGRAGWCGPAHTAGNAGRGERPRPTVGAPPRLGSNRYASQPSTSRRNRSTSSTSANFARWSLLVQRQLRVDLPRVVGIAGVGAPLRGADLVEGRLRPHPTRGSSGPE